MVPIFVLFTFAAFILIGLIVRWWRAAPEDQVADQTPHAAEAGGGERAAPSPLYLHPGHVWMRLMPDGIASVGATEFAANFAGTLSAIDTPQEGTRLRQGEPAWTLISARDRRLSQAMPLDGEVVAVNRGLVANLGLLQRSPQDEGWILRVRPSRIGESLQNLFSGALAETWREVTSLRLNAMLTPSLGRLANDGGVWVARFGDMLDDFTWFAMRRELFRTQSAAVAKPSSEQ